MKKGEERKKEQLVEDVMEEKEEKRHRVQTEADF
jgi:hypothetical protein